MVSLLCFHLFQPNSVAAKLPEGKNRRGSDSAEFHHRTGSGGKDKATDVSNRTTHYGAPQVPAKTPIINALPVSNQRKQPAASSINFYQTIKGETSINSFNRQGLSQLLSVPPAARGLSHPSRVNSQRVRRHSDSTHRHLLQVSHVCPYARYTDAINVIRVLFLISLSWTTLGFVWFAAICFHRTRGLQKGLTVFCEIIGVFVWVTQESSCPQGYREGTMTLSLRNECEKGIALMSAATWLIGSH